MIINCNRKYGTKFISNVSWQKSKCVQSGRMSLVDPWEFLSRNDTAAARRGVALQSVLELISAEAWGFKVGPISQSSLAVKFSWGTNQKGTEGGLVLIPNVWYIVKWRKCCFKKSSFEESWYVSCGGFFVSNLFSKNIRGACIVTKMLLKRCFLKWDCYMRISFSIRSKSPRCEGKVLWSCSVLRARPQQSSKPALGFWGGKVEDVRVICFIYCEKKSG